MLVLSVQLWSHKPASSPCLYFPASSRNTISLFTAFLSYYTVSFMTVGTKFLLLISSNNWFSAEGSGKNIKKISKLYEFKDLTRNLDFIL